MRAPMEHSRARTGAERLRFILPRPGGVKVKFSRQAKPAAMKSVPRDGSPKEDVVMPMDFDGILQFFMARLRVAGIHDFCQNISDELRDVFQSLTSAADDDGATSSGDGVASGEPQGPPGSADDRGASGAPCNSTTSTYMLIKSMEMLGNSKMAWGEFVDAYGLYKMAHVIYVDRFDRTFFKARDLKRRMARALLCSEDYRGVFEELRGDARVANYETTLDAETTLYIRYAYGRSLLALGMHKKAIPYLMQGYLGRMNARNKGNMHVLNTTLALVVQQVLSGRVELAMSMATKLLGIFGDRLRSGDCPAELVDFASILAIQLHEGGRHKELAALYKFAAGIHARQHSLDTLLLISAIGCSLVRSESRRSHPDAPALASVIELHGRLLPRAAEEDLTVDRLMATTRIILVFADKSTAINILVATYDEVSKFLPPDDPRFEFFRNTANASVWTKE